MDKGECNDIHKVMQLCMLCMIVSFPDPNHRVWPVTLQHFLGCAYHQLLWDFLCNLITIICKCGTGAANVAKIRARIA